MKKILIGFIYAFVFHLGTNILFANDYAENEIIVKFKKGYLTENYLNSKGEFLKTKNSLIMSKISRNSKGRFEKFINDSTGDKTEIRKLARRFMPKDSISIARNGKKINISDILNICVIDVKDTIRNIKEICDSLSNLDFIVYAEPNYLIEVNDNPPNDTRFNLQRGLEQSNDIDIDANRAWDFTTGNSGIKVGVIDDGIDYDHEDLGDGVFGVSGAKVRGGWDYVNDNSDPDFKGDYGCSSSHGTEVAGIIGAYRNNDELGIAGLAGGDGGNNTGCQLFSLKVGYNRDCKYPQSLVIEAIFDGSNSSPGYGCDILNLSLGGDNYNEGYRGAIRVAAKNNVVVVASKGNDNSTNYNYPSDYDANWVVSVGATDHNDERVDFGQPPTGWGSNMGNGIDVAAPGTLYLIHTTEPVENGSYRSFNGTSAAAPVVSGQAALILAEALEQGISLHHNDVEWLIKVSAEDVNSSTLPGYDDDLGHGRVNVGRSLEYMNKPWELNHHTATGGTVVNSTGWYNMNLYNPDGGLPTAYYYVKRYEVQKTITMPDYLNDGYVWCRTSNETIGWSAANPNHQMGYCDIVSRNGSSVTLRTFIYDIETLLGQHIGMRPATANNVVFAYTTLGIPCKENIHMWETLQKSTIDTPVEYFASNNITASNVIEAEANIKYQAGNKIVLWPGFSSKKSSNFHAKIDNCETFTLPKSNFDEKFNETDNTSLKIVPNPFNNQTTITVSLSSDNNISLAVYDVLGNKIHEFAKNKMFSAGEHNFTFSVNNLQSGMFYVNLIGDGFRLSKPIMLMK